MITSTTTETMEGRFHPLPQPEADAATRGAFLGLMLVITLAVLGHLAFLMGAMLQPLVLP